MIEERFRAAVEAGRFQEIVELYAPDAEFDAALAGRDVRLRGREAIAGELGSWWPAPAGLDQWDAGESDHGLRVLLERSEGPDGSSQRSSQYHLLHVSDGRISRHYVFSQHSRFGPPPDTEGPVPSFLRTARDRQPLPHAGDSGSYLEKVIGEDGQPLVVKHISRSWDWIMRATRDTGREAEMWLDGTLQDLPSAMEYPVVAVEREGAGWAIAMRDISASLIEEPLAREDAGRLLDAADQMHRRFEGQELAGACTLADRVFMFSPGVARAERSSPYLMPKIFGRAWELFAEVAGDDELAAIILGLAEDPAPLIAELEQGATTLLHGDFTAPNLGLTADQVLAFDWSMACKGPPEVDFMHYLHSYGSIPVDRKLQLIADWRSIRGADLDEQLLSLASLYEVVIIGWCWPQAVWAPNPDTRQKLRTDMAWWLDQARRALEIWSP
jgi:hypothetical protein